MRKATLMVSQLPSQAYCPLHSVTFPSWLMARDKAYNVLVCHLSASLCAESHKFLRLVLPPSLGQYLGKSLWLQLWLHHPCYLYVPRSFRALQQYISSTYSRGTSLSWTHLCSVAVGSHTTPPQCMVLSTALITCYCLLEAISIIVLLLPDIWVWLSYQNVSCNVSETSVVLPGPASVNPPNVHATL